MSQVTPRRWLGALSTRLCLLIFIGVPLLAAQTTPPAPQVKPSDDYSGMYSFLKDGEFVQLTIEDDGRVTGFVSRFGDAESDKGAFLDQFFRQGKLDGNKLSFTTETVHGVWYEFKGAVERGEGKNPPDEAYYVMKGTLIESRTDAQKKTSSKSREVIFKSFPKDLDSAPAKKD